MLPVAERLRHRRQFQEVVWRGRRAAGPVLVAYLLAPHPRPVGALPRVGFVVGRTVGGAVVRNTVRRRLRHLVAARIGSLPAGSSLVIRATPVAASTDSAGLAAQLDRALARLAARSPAAEEEA